MAWGLIYRPTLYSVAARHTSDGHTGGASGAVHQGPRPLGPTSEDQIAIFLKN